MSSEHAIHVTIFFYGTNYFKVSSVVEEPSHAINKVFALNPVSTAGGGNLGGILSLVTTAEAYRGCWTVHGVA